MRIDDTCVWIRFEPVSRAGDEEPEPVDAMVMTPVAVAGEVEAAVLDVVGGFVLR